MKHAFAIIGRYAAASIAMFILFFSLAGPARGAGQRILIAAYESTPEYVAEIQAFSEAIKQAAPNVEIITLEGDGSPDDFVLKVQKNAPEADLIFTVGPTNTMLVKASGTQKPVLFSRVYDPKKMGLVRNMQKPGTNFTGSFNAISIIRQIHCILDVIPTAKRVGIIYDQRDPMMRLRADDWVKAIEMTPGMMVVRCPIRRGGFRRKRC